MRKSYWYNLRPRTSVRLYRKVLLLKVPPERCESFSTVKLGSRAECYRESGLNSQIQFDLILLSTMAELAQILTDSALDLNSILFEAKITKIQEINNTGSDNLQLGFYYEANLPSCTGVPLKSPTRADYKCCRVQQSPI